jgi:ATP-dependent helicase/nuclease subunit A
MPDLTDEDYLEAERQQAMAANPVRDVFVSANAGSGKTHVLVNRVSRTLLLGRDIKPEKILCLTYTKAAASEMQTRLFKTLGDWSIMPEDKLRAALVKLLGEVGASQVDLGHARSLFAQALETPEGLKVQTIHAFCERLLSRFPMEAGILPGFDAIEDGAARAMQDDVWREILRRAAKAPGSELAQALAEIMGSNANKTIEGLRRWMGFNVYKIIAWEQAGGIAPLEARLGVSADMSEAQIKRSAWEAISKPRLQAAIDAIRMANTKAQNNYADKLTLALKTADPVEAFDLYANVVLKKDGTPITKIGIKNSGPAAHEFFGAPKSADTQDMAALSQAMSDLKSLRVLTHSCAAFELSRNFAQIYQARKRDMRKLDFADQIMLARRLLTQSHVSDWVRYKLDGGVDYILVDEAQDTSPEQWDIVDVMRDMFTHDQNADPRFPRTLFAVGDEKQSIYSFQGADPELFMTRSRREDGGPDEAIRMRMSFRSAPDILAFIDEIFAAQKGLQKMFNPALVTESSDVITHTAKRKIPGLIELWPLSPAPETGAEELPWRPEPVDAESANSARETLARELAAQIRRWLDSRELINAREGGQETVRPIEPRDILILVRKRTGSFFNAVIRHLKWKNIAVAGADRLILSESIAVQDLMSLARFVCLPADDLALAEVLRGPLFNLSESALFRVAHGRKGRLWPALKSAADLENRDEICARLSHFIDLSKRYAPYEFFESVLSFAAADGTSQLKAFYRRLSMEAADPIDAFLARALAHQRRGAPSLQHFIQEFMHDDQDIKRELDGTRNEVRVMTIYGAKGLEAPVVILPDTSQPPTGREALDAGMLDLGDGTFARPGNTRETPDALLTLRSAKVEKAYQEYMRLFYVALTRAEARLLICGYFSGKPTAVNAGQAPDPRSWHALAQNALSAMDSREIETPFSRGDFKGYVYGARPNYAAGQTGPAAAPRASLPDWASGAHAPPAPKAAISSLSPSALLADGDGRAPANRSPFSQSPDRFLRGTLIHKLLELLPDIARDKRRAAAAQFLSGYSALSQAQRQEITQNVLAVLEAPEFAEVFAPGSQAEISLAGRAPSLPPHMRLNAQIDRISVNETRVFITDYKSNRPPPASPQEVSDVYLGQMAAYRELARAAYPGREIVCGLLWTDGPHMMILPDALLDESLEKIHELTP